MNRFALIAGLIVLVTGAIALLDSFYIVRQTEQVMVFRFGEVQRTVEDPGLHFKTPFLDDIVYYESRILSFDTAPEEVILADQKRLIVDAFTRYRIEQAQVFYETVRDERNARSRIEDIINSTIRDVLGKQDLSDLLGATPGVGSEGDVSVRAQIMDDIRTKARASGEALGIAIMDVRIKRADLPEQISQQVFDRMRSEREQEAKEFRAAGQAEGQLIRAEADKERTVVIAEAERDAQIIRGNGEAEATSLWAQAYGQNQKFYEFKRSLEAYTKALGAGDTTLVLSPDSDFFQFFNKLPE